MKANKNKKIYQRPKVEKVNIDNQISLAMTSPSTPPEDPFDSGFIDMKKMLEQDKIENA